MMRLRADHPLVVAAMVVLYPFFFVGFILLFWPIVVVNGLLSLYRWAIGRDDPPSVPR